MAKAITWTCTDAYARTLISGDKLVIGLALDLEPLLFIFWMVKHS